jgi:pheromone shutdown-related protein TraB
VTDPPRATVTDPPEPSPLCLSTGHVEHVEHQGRDLFIVGTAHVSQKSVEEVEQVIEAVRPDTVCVELDDARYRALTDDSEWLKLDLFTVIRQKKVLFLLTRTVLAAYQRKMGQKLGVRPGAELLAAVRKAEQLGARVVLADRDIQATLKRTWHGLSFWNKAKLASSLMAAPFAIEEITEEQVEQLKQRDNISDMMSELARVMPQVKVPLIDERDRYLMSNIQEAPGHKVVAVVGACHVEGILSHLGDSVDREALTAIPRPSRVGQTIAWAIPLLFVVALAWGNWKAPAGTVGAMILAWVLPSALSTALFTLLGGAKPLTIVAGALAAPFTLLHPTIGVGMVTGPLEAWLRKPTVAECQSLSEDVLTLRGFYRNGITRVLLVVILSGIGAMLGGAIGASRVAHLMRASSAAQNGAPSAVPLSSAPASDGYRRR